ncbi:MAG TPA: hypothetical protein DEP05_04885 [Betaproteobacteria bacterium]|nr:hypothetical protein [Betaproteobacteria bacterium]
MAKVEYCGSVVDVASSVSVLDALLAHGHEIPHGCRAGACQSCLMQATQGCVPEAAQDGLKSTLKAQNYFLACRCQAATDLVVQLPQASAVRFSATVIERELLAEDVMALHLRSDAPIDYRAGQYMTLWRDERLGRSYSLASVPSLDAHLTFHVKRAPGGVMSGWIHDRLRTGETLQLQGPVGSCFYVPETADQNLLLAGTGTGLAPLYGIARDALHAGHRGDIHLFHGALDTAGLYLVDALRRLEARYSNFHYHPSVLRSPAQLPEGVQVGAIDRLISTTAPELTGWKVFLCGAPDLVAQLRKRIFLAGAHSADIYADAFFSAAPPPS